LAHTHGARLFDSESRFPGQFHSCQYPFECQSCSAVLKTGLQSRLSLLRHGSESTSRTCSSSNALPL
jgi:hypothetical protein